jgi:hypothetical protein
MKGGVAFRNVSYNRELRICEKKNSRPWGKKTGFHFVNILKKLNTNAGNVK